MTLFFCGVLLTLAFVALNGGRGTNNKQKKMTAMINILQNKFGGSKNLPTFVMPNVLRSFDLRTHIQATAFNKAKFPLIQSHFGDFGRLAKTSRSFASFVVNIPQVFCYQMPNVTKNLNSKTAPGASCSTTNTRKRVTSTCTPIERNLFQITMDLVAVHLDDAGLQRRCGIIHCDLYEARSEDEALGLALAVVRKKYSVFYDIDLRSIKRERHYKLTCNTTTR